MTLLIGVEMFVLQISLWAMGLRWMQSASNQDNWRPTEQPCVQQQTNYNYYDDDDENAIVIRVTI